MIKMIIFDFDGTLVDSWKEIVEVFNSLAPRYGCKSLKKEDVFRLRNGRPQDFIKEFGLNFLTLPLMAFSVKRALARRMNQLPWQSGILSVLTRIHQTEILLGILTSNSEKNVASFLKVHGAEELFLFIRSCRKLFGKQAALLRILKKYSLHPYEIVYVGDEVRDIEAARGAGVISVGVTWGSQTRQALLAAQPDYLCDTPEELFALCNRAE